VKSDKEAIQTRDYCVAKNATLRADHPGPSDHKSRGPQNDNHALHGGLNLRLVICQQAWLAV
jgi:hypothetical protein